MHNASIKERMFLCLVMLSFFVLIVSLLALTIAEDQTTQRRRQKPPPMLGIISDTSSVRESFYPSAHHRFDDVDCLSPPLMLITWVKTPQPCCKAAGTTSAEPFEVLGFSLSIRCPSKSE